MDKREELWQSFQMLEGTVRTLKGVVQNDMTVNTEAEREEVLNNFLETSGLVKERLNRLEGEVEGYIQKLDKRFIGKVGGILGISFLQPYIEKGYKDFQYVSGEGVILSDESKVECTDERMYKLVEMLFKEAGKTIEELDGYLETRQYRLKLVKVGSGEKLAVRICL